MGCFVVRQGFWIIAFVTELIVSAGGPAVARPVVSDGCRGREAAREAEIIDAPNAVVFIVILCSVEAGPDYHCNYVKTLCRHDVDAAGTQFPLYEEIS